jgi:hypothetical protein
MDISHVERRPGRPENELPLISLPGSVAEMDRMAAFQDQVQHDVFRDWGGLSGTRLAVGAQGGPGAAKGGQGVLYPLAQPC